MNADGVKDAGSDTPAEIIIRIVTLSTGELTLKVGREIFLKRLKDSQKNLLELLINLEV